MSKWEEFGGPTRDGWQGGQCSVGQSSGDPRRSPRAAVDLDDSTRPANSVNRRIGQSWPVRFRLLTLGMAFVASMASIVTACNVPVFRYALERWRPDPFRLTLFHRGPLSPADQQLFAMLDTQLEKTGANVVVDDVDLAASSDQQDAPTNDVTSARLPLLVLRYPPQLQIPVPIWTGPLTKDSFAQMTDSATRREIVRRLVDGQTAVWLLLESGQAAADDAAAVLIEEQLQRLEQQLKLPELTSAEDDKLLAATPLKLSFSLLRVPRGDADQPLIQTLLHAEPDLLDRSDPMVFPIFGRGRAMWPLIGPGITASNIHETASFLVGACSCEIKDLNPGFDLLIATDWDALLHQEGVPLIAKATRNVSLNDEPVLVPIPRGSKEVEPLDPAPFVIDPTTPATRLDPAQVLTPILIVAIIGLVVAIWSRGRNE